MYFSDKRMEETMAATTIKKRPHAGTATARVWEIADEVVRKTGTIPTGRQVVDIYVAEGFHESTGFTQYSHWKKAHQDHFKRGFTGGPATQTGPSSITSLQLTIGVDGRVVIPSEMRAAMQLGADGKVTARVVDGELRVIAPAVAIRRARDLVRSTIPGNASLADELITERRAEAHLEDAT
jgi:bifunctional DNA-binding transcriptional regulator/antitoxin component of YhaV-PrlF toxin-antitoxin module